MPSPTRAALEEQRRKYRLLEELSAGQPGRNPARRDTMRGIAEHFPGALREWESLSPEELADRRARVDALCLEADDRELATRLAAPELVWLRLAISVEARLRQVLVERRRSPAPPATTAGLRLSSCVHVEVARAEGLPVEALKAALFPSSRTRSLEEPR